MCPNRFLLEDAEPMLLTYALLDAPVSMRSMILRPHRIVIANKITCLRSSVIGNSRIFGVRLEVAIFYSTGKARATDFDGTALVLRPDVFYGLGDRQRIPA